MIGVHLREIEAAADLHRLVEEAAEDAEVVLEAIRGRDPQSAEDPGMEDDVDRLRLVEEALEDGLEASAVLAAARPHHA